MTTLDVGDAFPEFEFDTGTDTRWLPREHFAAADCGPLVLILHRHLA